MVISKNSPNNRRRSIAVTNQIPSAASAKMRRRAHSIAPGSSLSPGAKARRSLAPRKSILKSSFTALNVDPSSQGTQSSGYDETGSWDATNDFSAPVRDNTTRKSMGRRVSFAATSHVRMIEPNKNSSPQSSPTHDTGPPRAPTQQQDENNYPGAKPGRRSSVRYSMAESDMDVTTVFPPAFPGGSAILDEEFDDYGDEDMDMEDDTMDITQPIRGNLARKSSISGTRQPLAELEVPDSEEELEEEGNSRSTAGEESFQSEAPSEKSVMEFTIPLGQSLRPPPEEDPAWVALKQIANSGNAEASFEEGDSRESGMGLEDAMERLQRVRDSMSLQSPGRMAQDETFTSTEDSFESSQGLDDGNKTMNLSTVLGRVSLARPSVGYPESNMDESEVYGSTVPPPPPQPPATVTSDPAPRPSVFQRPSPSDTPQAQRAATPPSVAQPTAPPSTAFTFTAPPPRATTPSANPTTETPSKAKPKPTFTAAFAPPVPRKSIASPAKRPHVQDDNDGLAQPSPAKRQALSSKWTNHGKDVPTSSGVPEPKPLSPSKKARFEAPAAERPTALRQPSGYFSKRKSLAVGFATQASEDETETGGAGARKKAAFLQGRASLGGGTNDAWTRFNKNAPSVPIPAPSTASTATTSATQATPSQGRGKEQEAATCVREAARQAMAAPSPTRGSPAPQRLPPIPESPLNLGEEMRAPVITINDQPMRDSSASQLQDTHHEDSDDDTGPIKRQLRATQQWRNDVAQEELVDEDIPSISIAQFFSLTGIKFMDELTAPRKSIHPSQQPSRQARNPADIPLAEYVTAMAIDGPQLDLYSRVSRDLEAWMEKSKEVFWEAEEEARKVTPELFVEYARADEEGQAELLHQLNLIRTHTRYLAKSDWYDWKLKWVEGLRTTADDAFRSLEKDARILEGLKKSVDAVLPDLEREYEQLQAELEHERAQVEEIEACDQDFLNDLKADISEQSIVIEGFKAELREQQDQLRWLSERKSEIATQKKELKNRIATSRRALNRNQTSTRGEVFRLRDELHSLEELHMFKVTRVDSNMFEYVYASRYQITIPCTDFKPLLPKITITRLPHSKQSRTKDDLPRLTNFLITVAQQMITQSSPDDPSLSSVRQVMYRLNDFWSSCAQLRTQLRMLGVLYPLEVIVGGGDNGAAPRFRIKAKVVFVGPASPTEEDLDGKPKPTSVNNPGKADISFDFSLGAFGKWPMKVDMLECDVDVAYGSIGRSAILEAVSNRLRQATPAESFGCLLEACKEAQALALKPQPVSQS